MPEKSFYLSVTVPGSRRLLWMDHLYILMSLYTVSCLGMMRLVTPSYPDSVAWSLSDGKP